MPHALLIFQRGSFGKQIDSYLYRPTGLHTQMPLRRSIQARDKPYVCHYTGCKSSFFYLHHLRRHETNKHGRTPRPRSAYPSHLDTFQLSLPSSETTGSSVAIHSSEVHHANFSQPGSADVEEDKSGTKDEPDTSLVLAESIDSLHASEEDESTSEWTIHSCAQEDFDIMQGLRGASNTGTDTQTYNQNIG